MYDDISAVGIIFSILVVVLFVFCVGYLYSEDTKHPTYYEYVDMDGNKGESANGYGACSYDSYGGQGAMVCELKDGTIIQVKQYKERKR